MLKRPKQRVALSLDTQTTVPSGVPTFVAFGEPDDHLRLSALIAHELGERTGKRDEVAACLTPKATWADRRNTLKRLIGRVQPKTPRGIVAVIVDLDALLPDDDDDAANRWDDWDFRAQRRQLFELLIDAIGENGWMAIRPRPRIAVNQKFPEDMIKLAKSAYNGVLRNKYNGEPLGKVAQRIGSAYVPLLDWLLGQKRGPSFEDLEDILEVGRVSGLQRHLVMQICDMLPPLALEAAIVISAVRGPQQLNGSLGPFSLLATNEASAETRAIEESAWRLGAWRTPARSQVDLLHQCGFLQSAPWVGPDYVYMPNVIRRHLQGLGWLATPERQEERHGWLANGESRMNAGGIGSELEMHFHAVRGHDLERAKATSRYYGADLRELAFHRSRRAAEKRRPEEAGALYREAADIYKLIIDDFDSDDAYAHEYLGYNLARAVELDVGMGKPMGEEIRARILDAYRFAAEKEPNNPLFEGRWLGFRAQCGEDVRDVFEAKLEGYRKNVSDVAAGYFAEAVLHGWSRNSNRRALAEELRQKWAPHVTRLREPLHEE